MPPPVSSQEGTSITFTTTEVTLLSPWRSSAVEEKVQLSLDGLLLCSLRMSSTSGGKRYRSEDDGLARSGGSKKAKKAVKTVFSGFWDEGVVADDGCIDYTGLNLTIGKDIFEVRVGDAVMLRGDDGHEEDAGTCNRSGSAVGDGKPAARMTEAKVGDGLMLARVERIWQEKCKGGRSGKILFQARWFLKVCCIFLWRH
jgi:hypothetical protein